MNGCLELRVRFAETDQMGIAHHSAYVVWLEAARIEWLRSIGLSYRQLENEGVSLGVSALEISYRAAARFDDVIRVDTGLTAARSRRLSFRYRIVRPSDDTLLASGCSHHTPTDRRGRSKRLPDAWLAPLLRHVVNWPHPARRI